MVFLSRLLNPIKTKALVISRSRTIAPIFSNLLNGNVVERVAELNVLGVVLDTKPSLESHIRLIAASASNKDESTRKALSLFCNSVLVLPVLEYCFPVWIFVAASHLCLPHRVVTKTVIFDDGLVVYGLEQRCWATGLCIF